jgi:hypothetical protein
MDAANAAAQSDPVVNRQFSRPWVVPPPQKRKRRPRAGAAPFGNQNTITTASNTTPDLTAARAIRVAAARVGRLQHQARMLRGIGQTDAALRLAGIADAIVAEVLL